MSDEPSPELKAYIDSIIRERRAALNERIADLYLEWMLYGECSPASDDEAAVLVYAGIPIKVRDE